MSLPTGAPNLEFARKLIQHCCWEDERVWTLAIAPLSAAQFARETRFGLGSIQRECEHIMRAEWMGLKRIRGEATADAVFGFDPEDRGAMRVQWGAIHGEWRRFASELDAESYFADCVIADGGRDVTLKAWQLLFDVIYQGAAHRSDIMRMVAEVHETPEFDLSLMQFLSGVFRE